MGSPRVLKEVRIIIGTGISNAFVNAATAAWNTTNATKYRAISLDLSGLTKSGLDDMALQTRKHAKPAPIVGLTGGSAKFSVYAGAADADKDVVNPAATLFGASVGTNEPPGLSRTGVTVGTSTPNNIAINSSAFNAKAGQAILVGVRGDGTGEGEVKVVQLISGSNGLIISPACKAAPAAGTALVCSTTVYYNESAAQQYADALFLGHATSDQRQVIGGCLVAGLSSLGLGEKPQIDLELFGVDNRLVPADARASGMDHDAAKSGNDPPVGGVGLLHVGDYTSNTRTTIAAGSFALDTGITYEPKPNPAGPNGIGDWIRMPGVPKFTVNMLQDEDEPGLDADFDAKTNKRVLYQMGHTAQRAIAIDIPKCHLTGRPTEAAEGNFSAVACTFEGDEVYVDSDELNSAVMRVHWF